MFWKRAGRARKVYDLMLKGSIRWNPRAGVEEKMESSTYRTST